MKLSLHKFTAVFGILCFIAFLVVLWTYSVVGKITEDKFNELLASHGKHNIKILNYKRSWFSSDVTLIVYFDAQNILHWQDNKLSNFVDNIVPQKELNYILLKANIHHGPFIYYQNKLQCLASVINVNTIFTQKQRNIIESNILDDENKKQFLSTILNKLIEAKIVIDFSGNGNAKIVGNEFTYKTTDVALNWHGFTWQIDFAQHLSKLDSELKFFGFNVKTNAINVDVSKFEFVNNYIKIDERILPSYKSFILPELQIKIFNDKPISVLVDNVRYQSTLKNSSAKKTQEQLLNNTQSLKDKPFDANKLLCSDLSLTIDKIQYNANNYSNIVFIWNADNLNIKGYTDFFRSLTQLRQADRPTGLALAYFFEVMLRLLNNGVVFNVHQLSLNTPWGKLDLVANAEFKHKINTSSWIMGLMTNSEILLQLSISHDLVLHILEEYYKYNLQIMRRIDNDNDDDLDNDDFSFDESKDANESLLEDNSWHEKAKITLDNLLDKNRLVPNNLNQYVIILNYAKHKVLLNGQELKWRM